MAPDRHANRAGCFVHLSAALQTYLKHLWAKSLDTFIDLAKVMIPIMIAVRIADTLGWVSALGPLLEPVMALMGLPAETGIIWATTLLVGIYAGFAALPLLAGVEITVLQVSILAAIMLIAHGLPVEQAIVKRTGVTFIGTVLLRFGMAVIYGVIVYWICQPLGLLQQPVDISLFTAGGVDGQSHLDFARASLQSMGLIFIIIIALFLLLDAMEKIGLTERITNAMIPLIRLSGLNREIAPLTTIGVLLGLTYGGGLIIGESKAKNFSLRAKTLAMSWLSLSHGLIEDTGVMVALGASLWIILVGRVVMTLIVVRIMASLWPRTPEIIGREESARPPSHRAV